MNVNLNQNQILEPYDVTKHLPVPRVEDSMSTWANKLPFFSSLPIDLLRTAALGSNLSIFPFHFPSLAYLTRRILERTSGYPDCAHERLIQESEGISGVAQETVLVKMEEGTLVKVEEEMLVKMEDITLEKVEQTCSVNFQLSEKPDEPNCHEEQ